MCWLDSWSTTKLPDEDELAQMAWRYDPDYDTEGHDPAQLLEDCRSLLLLLQYRDCEIENLQYDMYEDDL